MSTVAATSEDICPYLLASETFIQFDLQINVTFTHIQNSSVVILSGGSPTNLTKFNKREVKDSGTTLLLSISETHYIITIPFDNVETPIVNFQIQNVAE
jgi:hypothetical protein